MTARIPVCACGLGFWASGLAVLGLDILGFRVVYDGVRVGSGLSLR